MKPDVRHWQGIDAEYLNRVLALNGINAQICGFEAKPVGTGQVGDCIRFQLEYTSQAADAPASLVGKFAAEDPNSRQFGTEFGIYRREVNFYKHLQPRAGISTPDCFLAEIDETTNEFVLLMSDEAPAAQGDQLEGIDLSQARTVAKEAAKFHSAFWLNQEVIALDWLQPSPQVLAIFQPEPMQAAWASFRERFGDLVSADAAHIGEAFVGNLGAYETMQKDHLCLVHVDFRPDNMLFATSKGGKPLSVVDWQSVGPGPAATDLGYCFAGALEPEVRQSSEQELLDLYAQELQALGAGPYDLDQLKRHYVLGAYQLFRTAFHSSLFVERTERGDAMFMKMLNGAVGLIHDHSAQDWFR